MPREHVDFGLNWNLRVPVPYSSLVIHGDRAWTSGQLALSRDGEVLCPGDVIGQAQIIANNADEILARGGLGPDDVSRIVLYCATPTPEIRGDVMALFAARFGSGALIETVPVPHFFYEGAVLEADIYCAPSEPLVEQVLPGGGRARFVREGNVVQMNLTAPVATLGEAIGGALGKHRLSPDQLLSGWGVAPEPALTQVPGQIAPRLPGFFSGALMPCYKLDEEVHLYLTFGEGDISIDESRGGRVRRHLARSGPFAVLDARFLGGSGISVGDQTREVMASIADMLDAHGYTFRDVVKSTTFHAGKGSPGELHDNLKIRNSYYERPGPASTSVPIARMADPGAKVRVELLLRPTAKASKHPQTWR